MQEKIDKEVYEGRVVGPFREPPVPNLRVSPLGLVPKKVEGEYRLIHHLSYPEGRSVNDQIPHELCSVHYTSFDTTIRMIRACGVGAELAKCDVKSAFRLLPVHPADFELLGLGFFIIWTEPFLWGVLFHARPLNPLVPSWNGN